ncbi:ABC transporter permease subunit [Austwickia chelonae]|uniref:ABC transporter permease subunit n=1 Tax=Austwickia chelonae TaxID=100225 RepID=UPI000E283D04|nr:ABC transporter permease subunit [Austwickia chelonae]
MNIAPLYQRWLADHRRRIIGWILGLTGVCLLYLPLFPSMRDSGLIGDKLNVMPKEMIDTFGMDVMTMSTGWGYTHQTVFGMLGLLLLLVLAISQGAEAIAGDEESGALELTLAHATDRRSVLTARLLAVTSTVIGVTAALTLVVAALSAPSQLDLLASGLFAEGAALALLALVHGLLALSVGAATGRRSTALNTATVIGVLGWFAHNMGTKVASWVPDLSPFHWAFRAQPLQGQADLLGLTALILACLVLVATAYIGFLHRDLRA